MLARAGKSLRIAAGHLDQGGMTASKRRAEGRSGEAAAVYGQLLAAGGGRLLAVPPAVAAGLAVAYVLAGANDAAEALLARCEAEEAAAAADWAARRTDCTVLP